MCDCEGAFLNGGFFLTPITGSIGIFDVANGIFDAARREFDRLKPFTCLPEVDGIETIPDSFPYDIEGATDALDIFLYRCSTAGVFKGVESSSSMLFADDS